MIDVSKFVVITKKNYRQYAATYQGGIHPREELVPILWGSTGYKGWQSPDMQHVFKGPRPAGPTIPRSQWADLLKAGAGQLCYQALLDNNIKSKDQGSLNYCWVFGSTRAVELRRCRESLAHIELSPESVGGPATNWRNVGGYAGEAFQQMETGGICEASYLDAPCSLKPSRWKTGWQDNAKKHAVVDWYNLDSSNDMYADQVSTMLGNGTGDETPLAVGLGWWSHLICFLCPVLLPDGTVGCLCQNSWLQGDWPRKGDNGLFILDETMATADGAAAPILTIDSGSDPAA